MSVTVLHSPNNKTTLRFFFEDGNLSYCAEVADRTAVAPSPIGVITKEEDFTAGLSLVRETYGSVNESYTIPAFKKGTCLDCCNTVDLLLSKNGRELLLQGRAYDDGVAFRLQLLGEGDVAITSEECGFCMPEEAKNIYGMKLIMSYEDHYHPIPLDDIHQNAYAFPMLCELGGGKWALYAEAGVFGTYGGSNLLSTKESPRMLMTKKSNDKVSPITGKLPLATPWRVILTGNLAVLQDFIYAIVLIIIVIYNNAPGLKSFREKYNIQNLFAKIASGMQNPAKHRDDEAKWHRVPTKIEIDEVLSTKIQRDPTTSIDPDKGGKD